MRKGTRQARRRRARQTGAPDGEAPSPQASVRKIPQWARRLGDFYGVRGALEYGSVVWLLALGTVASYVGRGAVMPFITVYLTLVNPVITLPFAGVGLIVEQVVRAVLSPVFGGLSDRYGRKPFMVAGLLLQSVTIPLYVFVDGPSSFLTVAVLAGLGQAPYQPALSAFLVDHTPRERRVGVFGLVHMMKNLGYAIGIALGAVLVTGGYGLLFVTGGVFPLTFALLILFVVPEMRARRQRLSAGGRHPLVAALGTAKNPRFAAFLCIAMVTFVSWGALANVLPVFISDPAGLGLDARWVSRAFMVNSLLVVTLQVPVSERIASRVSRTKGLAFASVVTALAYVLLAASLQVIVWSPAWAQGILLLATVVITLAEMFDTPLLFALAADLAPPETTGGAMGVLGIPALVGFGAPLVITGTFRDAYGWMSAWTVLMALLLVGALGYMMLRDPTEAPAAPAAPAPRVPAAAPVQPAGRSR